MCKCAFQDYIVAAVIDVNDGNIAVAADAYANITCGRVYMDYQVVNICTDYLYRVDPAAVNIHGACDCRVYKREVAGAYSLGYIKVFKLCTVQYHTRCVDNHDVAVSAVCARLVYEHVDEVVNDRDNFCAVNGVLRAEKTVKPLYIACSRHAADPGFCPFGHSRSIFKQA